MRRKGEEDVSVGMLANLSIPYHKSLRPLWGGVAILILKIDSLGQDVLYYRATEILSDGFIEHCRSYKSISRQSFPGLPTSSNKIAQNPETYAVYPTDLDENHQEPTRSS